MTNRLFHFSDDPEIEIFKPRPVRVASRRAEGMDWLNGPLVWAIDETHSPLYLFPRDCPRIVMWRKPHTSAEDVARFLDPNAKMTAYVEKAWVAGIKKAVLFRYELPAGSFRDLDDAGMHVSCACVKPLGPERLSNLTKQLELANVRLRILDSLAPLKDAWSTTLSVSGIRLRNASSWARNH